MQLLIVIPALVTVISGAFAGIMLVQGRAQLTKSQHGYLYRLAPLVIGAVLVWLLMWADPLARYLPNMYLMTVWVAFYHTRHYRTKPK